MFGAIASLAGTAIGAGLSMYNNYSNSQGSNAKGASQLSTKQYERQKQIDTQWQVLYDKWKSNLDYKYAQQYGQNSASWMVEGLKRAGLNPILAATDGSFASTYGSPSSGSPSSANGSTFRQGRGTDPALAAAAMANTARQNELLEAQKENVEAQTRQLEQNTQNAKETGGLSGGYGAVHSALTKLGLLRGDTDATSSTAKDAIKRDSDGRPIVSVEKVADLDAFGRNKFERLMHDFDLYLRSGGPFGNKRSRMAVIQDEMDNYHKRQY